MALNPYGPLAYKRHHTDEFCQCLPWRTFFVTFGQFQILKKGHLWGWLLSGVVQACSGAEPWDFFPCFSSIPMLHIHPAPCLAFIPDPGGGSHFLKGSGSIWHCRIWMNCPHKWTSGKKNSHFKVHKCSAQQAHTMWLQVCKVKALEINFVPKIQIKNTHGRREIKYSAPGLCLLNYKFSLGRNLFQLSMKSPKTGNSWQSVHAVSVVPVGTAAKNMADIHAKVLLFLFSHSGKHQESLKCKTHSYVTMKEKSLRRRQGGIEGTHSNKSAWQIASAVSIHPHNGSPIPWPVIEE